jgi:hypothetical protein
MNNPDGQGLKLANYMYSEQSMNEYYNGVNSNEQDFASSQRNNS